MDERGQGMDPVTDKGTGKRTNKMPERCRTSHLHGIRPPDSLCNKTNLEDQHFSRTNERVAHRPTCGGCDPREEALDHSRHPGQFSPPLVRVPSGLGMPSTTLEDEGSSDWALPPQGWEHPPQACDLGGEEPRTSSQGGVVDLDCLHYGFLNSLDTQPLWGAEWAENRSNYLREQNRAHGVEDRALPSDSFPIKVLCMACQVSGTIPVYERQIPTDCAWCGKRDTLAYLDPTTMDPCNDPQPLLPAGALTVFSLPPVYIYRLQAELGTFRECSICHRFLKRAYNCCPVCNAQLCNTPFCALLHHQACLVTRH